MDARNHLKWHKITQGQAKGPPNSRKGRKKGMPKTKPKKGAKMDAKRSWNSWPGGVRVATHLFN